MLDNELIKKLDRKDPAVWLATWFGCGLMKQAPGTWGTLGGLPFGLLLLYAGGWPLLLAATVIVFTAGYYAAHKFEQITGEHDSSAIVIDEVAGIWLTLAAAPMTVPATILAFALFRFFDIMKPWPVSYFDRLPGAMGVMSDDIMAGIYAAAILWGLRYAGLI
jgi:phosphatidylglycerophosphatase A